MNENSQFCRVPIKFAIKFASKLPFDIYVKLSDTKIIKIDHHDSNLQERFLDYQRKGLTELYALRSEYKAFVDLVQRSFSSKIFSSPSGDKFTFEVLDSHYEVLKETLTSVGISDPAIALAREISCAAFNYLTEVPRAFRFFRRFASECDIGFSSNMLVAYTCSIVVAGFPWGTNKVKEKMFLAALLCDITLSKEEYIQMRDNKGDPRKMPSSIFKHPEKIIEILSAGASPALSQEVLHMISQHHERPGGTGYPFAIDHKRITILSAVFIISHDFCSAVGGEGFNPEELNSLMLKFKNRYANGSFKKAYLALENVIGTSSSSLNQ